MRHKRDRVNRIELANEDKKFTKNVTAAATKLSCVTRLRKQEQGIIIKGEITYTTT